MNCEKILTNTHSHNLQFFACNKKDIKRTGNYEKKILIQIILPMMTEEDTKFLENIKFKKIKLSFKNKNLLIY